MTERITWPNSVTNIIVEVCLREKKTRLTMKELRQNYLDKIVEETQSGGKTPHQTLARILQNIRDMGIITFQGKGNYTFVKHPSDEVEGKTKSKTSQGEKLLGEILTEKNLKYTSQFIDPRIRNINPLPFDFMINIANKKILIEFDGEDHYQVVKRSRSELKNWVNFFRRKRLDRIKNEGAEEHGYMLVRIRRDQVLSGKVVNKKLLESTLLSKLAKIF